MHTSNLEEYELESEGEGRLPFMLTVPEIKLLLIAGVRPFNIIESRDIFLTRLFVQVGFFLDGKFTHSNIVHIVLIAVTQPTICSSST